MPAGYMNLKDIAEGEAPAGWDWRVINRQGGRGIGVSSKFGPKPPSPDSVAPRGTPQWRAAFNAEQDYIKTQLSLGATMADMGYDPNNRENLPNYMRLRQGEYGGFRKNWYDAAKGFGRGYYDFKTNAYSPSGGAGVGYQGSSFESPEYRPGPGLSNASVPTPAMGTTGTAPAPLTPAAPISSTDSYMDPRLGKRKMTLRSLLGGGEGGSGVSAFGNMIRRGR